MHIKCFTCTLHPRKLKMQQSSMTETLECRVVSAISAAILGLCWRRTWIRRLLNYFLAFEKLRFQNVFSLHVTVKSVFSNSSGLWSGKLRFQLLRQLFQLCLDGKPNHKTYLLSYVFKNFSFV